MNKAEVGTVLVLIAAVVICGLFFTIRFFLFGVAPSSSDLKLAGGGLFVLWFICSLDMREKRQEEHFEEIKSRLSALEKRGVYVHTEHK